MKSFEIKLKETFEEFTNNTRLLPSIAHFKYFAQFYYIHARTMATEGDSNPELGAEEVELGAEDMAGLEDVRIKYIFNMVLLFAALLPCHD